MGNDRRCDLALRAFGPSSPFSVIVAIGAQVGRCVQIGQRREAGRIARIRIPWWQGASERPWRGCFLGEWETGRRWSGLVIGPCLYDGAPFALQRAASRSINPIDDAGENGIGGEPPNREVVSVGVGLANLGPE
jgi:hypothetical protein